MGQRSQRQLWLFLVRRYTHLLSRMEGRPSDYSFLAREAEALRWALQLTATVLGDKLGQNDVDHWNLLRGVEVDNDGCSDQDYLDSRNQKV